MSRINGGPSFGAIPVREGGWVGTITIVLKCGHAHPSPDAAKECALSVTKEQAS